MSRAPKKPMRVQRSEPGSGWFGRGAKANSAGASVTYSTSPLLASRTPPGRSKFLVFLLGAGFAALLARAVYIQIIGVDFYLKQGEMRVARRIDLPASRGRILDRNGQPLATSVPTPSLWAIPKDFDAPPEQRRELARLLGMKPAELEERIGDDGKFVWLRRQVDEGTAAKVRAMKLKGLGEVREYKREYPEGESVAQVVGSTDLDERGFEGIELRFQNDLAGRPGSRNVIRDRLGRAVEDTGNSVQPVQGRDVSLSIDSKVQFYAYQRLKDAVLLNKAKAGSAVVIDVQSGEVLALANYPSYVRGDRRDPKNDPMRNRALTDTFEPGSTMKPFVVSIALETHRVTPETVIQTAPGNIVIAGAKISDSHPHGPLTVAQVIQKSSNVGVVKLAMEMEPREMWEMFTQVGIGQRPQLAFPGVVTGRLRPYKSWRKIEQATMSYGYGLSASLFQLARAYTVFARDGELIPVTLTHQTVDDIARDVAANGSGFGLGTANAAPAQPDGGPLVAQPGVRVMSAKTAQAVRAMLRMAAGDGGTAPRAQTLGYSVGGKTGTARKQEGKGYAGNKYRAWFVGMAPIDHPRIVVAVMVDEPGTGVYFGGDVAAPVFSQVVQNTLRLMGVPPDLDVRTQVVADKHAPAEEESF